MNPFRYVYLGLFVGGLAAVLFIAFRKRRERFLQSGVDGLPDSTPLGDRLEAHTVSIDRVGLDSVKAEVEVSNPTGREKTSKITFHAIPTGGIEFGLDPFDAEELVTVPARSKVTLTFFNEDWAFAPFSTWSAEVSIDGIVVDRA